MKLKRLLFFYSLLLLTGFTACKKTIEAPQLSNSKIVEYAVPVSDSNILGVIDETDHTITVYLPFYYELNVIDPKIKLAAGATLKETPVPVDVLNDKTTYTVTGADKTTTTYKLIIKIQQDSPLVLQEHSTADNIREYAVNDVSFTVTGNFYTTDIQKIKTSLVSQKTGQETTLTTNPNSRMTRFGDGIYSLAPLDVTPSVDTGLYYVKVNKLGLTAQTKYPVRIKYVNPVIVVITANTFKQGETLTITPAGSVFVNFTSFTVKINGKDVDFPIVSYTRTSAVIKIPETLAPADYGLVSYTAKFKGYNDYTQSFRLTVTPK